MNTIYIGKGEQDVFLRNEKLNRHGLIAGATGTGKSTTLKVIAEQASEQGIPVFLPDVKGDMYTFLEAGSMNEKLEERLQRLGLEEFSFRDYPVECWDVFGTEGNPVRTTISDMGPILLSNLLELNEVQSGILNIAFSVADEKGYLLLDLKDLKAMLHYIGENAKELKFRYGNISPASVGAIQRALLVLENQGAGEFFGEPAVNMEDFFRVDGNGRGYINILDARVLYQKPKLYATFMLWLLSELYERLPEVGDVKKPKFMFFFDEAHLLFSTGSKPLTEKLEQVLRLIRSKGVSIFFVTQSPADIPDTILGQLGNKIQHSLRAFTPKDRKIIKETASNFRENPRFDTAEMLTNMGSGEALVSVLDEEGKPTITEHTLIAPPHSKFGTVERERILATVQSSPLYGKYKDPVDRESAYEVLMEKLIANKYLEQLEEERKREVKEKREAEREAARIEREKRRNRSFVEKELERMKNSAVGTVGRGVGRQILRGILGSILGK
ncbi:MAG: DUF853 family protein [Tissierellia bacterium]|nr:DUF853 family protein [Tissierellia bacterium]